MILFGGKSGYFERESQWLLTGKTISRKMSYRRVQQDVKGDGKLLVLILVISIDGQIY